MHELGIMTGVMESVETAARNAGALKVTEVRLVVGEMTEAVTSALEFAFEALREQSEYALCKDAVLTVEMIRPKSHCLACDATYEHDRFTMLCPECGSFATELLAGRELHIDSIEVDLPDGEDSRGGTPLRGRGYILSVRSRCVLTFVHLRKPPLRRLVEREADHCAMLVYNK